MIPKVSVIIPNYNHAQFLEQRLDSVFKQTFQDFEVILLDDCSTDNSIEIINNYKNHPKVSHVVLNTKNSGSPFIQWQKGINLAKGEFVWIAESDDYCKPECLEELLNYQNKADVIYCQSYDVDDNGLKFYDRLKYTKDFSENIWKSNFYMNGIAFIKRYLIIKNVIPNASAVIFKRSTIDNNLFTDHLLKMTMCGDWLFWIKILMKSDIYFVSKHLNFFRNHGNMSRNHSTLSKKRTRLVEESKIRNFIYSILKHNNKTADERLMNKWISTFKFSKIFSRKFRSVKMNYQNDFILYFTYFKAKLKK